jgi:hypothetical protein
MNNIFCTIITSDHYPRALALYRSIQKFDADIHLNILIVDQAETGHSTPVPANINFIYLKTLQDYPFVNELYSKYAHFDIDAFRWSMKPVFISYLLENGFSKVLYLDCDMFFFNSYQFLFDELDNSSILLTPNWINSNPLKDKDSFFSLFTSGLFSAGFIGANKGALPAMKWWAQACHFLMGDQVELGIRGDQKYLDVFPVKYENTKIIRHRGCNIGSWNFAESKRKSVNGSVMINGSDPIIFIHFDGMLVQEILRGHDGLLRPYFEEYKKTFEESGIQLENFIKTIPSLEKPHPLAKIKWSLRLRTRIKGFLYKLSQKL